VAELLPQLPLFMLAVLVLNATPGVDLLLTVTRTAQGGRRAGLMAALGINAGCALHALAAAFGLAALLSVSTAAFVALKWVGAAYLLWLGAGRLRSAWRGAPSRLGTATAASIESPWSDFRRGLLTNLLNPKVAFFMLAFLPQFIPASSAHKTAALLALGILFIVQSLLFLVAVVVFVAHLPRLPSYGARWLQAAAGVLFIVLAGRLAGTRFESHG
jgi:threonine/homoserine/homoserine lactone efflux protein